MDAESVCRCCLSKTIKLKSITTHVDAEGQTSSVQVILNECLFLETKINDGYPQKVCIRCINQLENILSFRTIALKSLQTFQHQTNKTKKKERTRKPPSDEEVKETVQPMKCEINSDESDTFGLEDSCDDFPDISKKIEKPKEKKANTYFYCTQCSSKFVQASELYKHCCEVHPSLNKKGDSCEYCNELFPDADDLKRHTKKHLNKWLNPQQVYEMYGKKDILCSYCGKSVSRNYYVQHIKIHQEKSYACKICGKKFSQLKGYKIHKNFHRAVPKYKCPQCDNVYRYLSTRNGHIRKVHNKEKTKVCPTCGKTFFCNNELKAHLLTHSGEKNHSCHLCGKAYQKKYGLTVHLKSHSK